jgi:hypothetical protein
MSEKERKKAEKFLSPGATSPGTLVDWQRYTLKSEHIFIIVLVVRIARLKTLVYSDLARNGAHDSERRSPDPYENLLHECLAATDFNSFARVWTTELRKLNALPNLKQIEISYDANTNCREMLKALLTFDHSRFVILLSNNPPIEISMSQVQQFLQRRRQTSHITIAT